MRTGHSTPESNRLTIDPTVLDAFCAAHAIKALYLFGSALTDAFDAPEGRSRNRPTRFRDSRSSTAPSSSLLDS
jgi:hypothetical protein